MYPATRAGAALALFLAAAGPGAANDSVAEMGAGGLVLGQSDAVSLVSETLFLSMEAVRVDYVFRNNTDRDIETLVAFPMPDIEFGPDAEVSIPRRDDNFLGFTVEADGQTIEPQLQQRAWANGIDVTEIVLGAGLPLAPLQSYGALDASGLTQTILSDLVSWGVVRTQYDEDTRRYANSVEPAWTLKSAYWWKMTFAARSETVMHHSYTPAIGGAAGLFMMNGDPDGPVSADYDEKYCTDTDFVKSVRKRQKDLIAKGGYGFTENWLSYVLTTGANWAGPIGHFRLILDKGSTANLVSFCGTGVRKTAPTTFEMEKEDFWPEKDLEILFLVAPEQ